MTDKPKPIIPGVQWEKRGEQYGCFICESGDYSFILKPYRRQPSISIEMYGAEVEFKGKTIFLDHYRDLKGARDALATWLEQLVEQLTGGELGGLRRSNAELLDAVDEIRSERDSALARVAELERNAAERSAPIPIGLGEVLISECHSGDGVLREMVIHAHRGEVTSVAVGTSFPDGYVGLPLPDGEILARIRIENPDGARLVLLESLELCINAAYAADGKPLMPLRAELEAKVAELQRDALKSREEPKDGS